MSAIGIDLGGTKIEAQVFDASWALASRHRIETPQTYDQLVRAICAQISWARTQAGPDAPIGIAAAGLINPVSNLALTANLPATGKPFARDIAQAAGVEVTYVNDCRALTLSEAAFGVAKGQSPAVGLIIGTGIGGGIAVNGQLLQGAAMIGGEFGHFSLSAAIVQKHNLPIVLCGCGRLGCTETLISGPGLTLLCQHLTGRALSPVDIARDRQTDPQLATVWGVWCALVTEMLMTLCLTVDPECIVLGGGLSQAPGVVDDLTHALQGAMLTGFAVPQILLAQGGDASGARGAAFAAYQAKNPASHPDTGWFHGLEGRP